MKYDEKLIEYIEGTKDFLLENGPSFFKEVVNYGRAVSILIFMIPLFVLFLSKTIKKLFKKMIDNDEPGYIPIIVLLFFAIIILSGVFLVNINTNIMCWFAPKYYILRKVLGK